MRFDIKKLWLSFGTVLMLLALGLVTGCGNDQSGATADAQAQTASKFVPTHFAAMAVDGARHHSSEWIGKKPVILNFWGTWCPPCRKEIPELVKLHKEYQSKGVELVSVAVRDTPDRVVDFTSAQGMDWMMLMAEQEILEKYNVTVGIPTTIFLDKHGKEVARFVGPRSYEVFKQATESILKSA